MDGPTMQDTYDHFIGSGALSYSWYLDVEFSAEHPNWCMTFRDDEDSAANAGPFYTLDHETIMHAVRTLAISYINGGASAPIEHERVSPDAMRECLNFLADPEGADFDADTADQVMQFAAFGRVIYG